MWGLHVPLQCFFNMCGFMYKHSTRFHQHNFYPFWPLHISWMYARKGSSAVNWCCCFFSCVNMQLIVTQFYIHTVLCRYFYKKSVEYEIPFPLTIAVSPGRDLHLVLMRNINWHTSGLRSMQTLACGTLLAVLVFYRMMLSSVIVWNSVFCQCRN